MTAAKAEKKSISVIERRLQGPSALYVPAAPIPLKEKGWTLRWGNAELSTDEIYRKVNKLGWEYVTPDDLACTTDEIGALTQDQRVVRGERGKEVLLKMRNGDYAKVQAQKDAENKRLTFDKKTVQGDVLNAVGNEHGSQAADFIRKSGLSVIDSAERVDLNE